MADKQALIGGLREQGKRAENMASQMTDEDWQMGVHEAGWTVKQAFCHLASTAGGVNFVIALANPQPDSGTGSGAQPFDINDFNKHQVGLRENKKCDEIVDELRQGIDSSMQALEGLDDEALNKEMTNFATGQPDTLAGVIETIMIQHYTGHLDEISSITGRN